jgi:hypothetical protein
MIPAMYEGEAAGSTAMEPGAMSAARRRRRCQYSALVTPGVSSSCRRSCTSSDRRRGHVVVRQHFYGPMVMWRHVILQMFNLSADGQCLPQDGSLAQAVHNRIGGELLTCWTVHCPWADDLGSPESETTALCASGPSRMRVRARHTDLSTDRTSPRFRLSH